LILPESLATHRQYHGIRINNEHLACVNVKRGDLVIAVETSIERGDLIAVSENTSGEVSCGFYDLEFGVLCIESCDAEPTLFDRDAVTIIGKVIGIADEPDSNGDRAVRPIRSRPITS
jgi:hypothetical protein